VTLAEIKRRVHPGQVYDVTNHYITKADHLACGTTRRTVTRVTAARFYMAYLAGGDEGPVDWPKSAQVSVDDTGVIRLRGGGARQQPDELFMTLVPVAATAAVKENGNG
jgi:hypothetical protein